MTHDMLDCGHEQLALVRPASIDGTGRHTATAGYIGNPRRLKAILSKYGDRGIQELLRDLWGSA